MSLHYLSASIHDRVNQALALGASATNLLGAWCSTEFVVQLLHLVAAAVAPVVIAAVGAAAKAYLETRSRESAEKAALKVLEDGIGRLGHDLITGIPDVKRSQDFEKQSLGEVIENHALSSPAAPVVEEAADMNRRNGLLIHPTTGDREYSADEREFLQAIASYKARSGRQFPTWSEVLEIVQELGYAKPTKPQE